MVRAFNNLTISHGNLKMEESMNHKLKILLPVCVLLGLVMVPWGGAAGPDGQSGASNMGHLYLYQKDPATRQIVQDGAWGKLKYNLTGPTFDFLFNGNELRPGTGYTLVYFKEVRGQSTPEVWCLGSAVADENGNIHIKGSVDCCRTLPQNDDQNYDPPITCGAKIRLLLSDDVYCDTHLLSENWQPSECLFENNLITYNAGDL
jgi:hypothetical protein